MVKKRKKKNAITLLALVITIVIMLLLAGVAIQMTMGENGLIAKSVQAQKEQAKAELYDTAKLSYMNLNAKALENGQPSPQVELALSTAEFTNKYNVVGDDVTDKKGTVIDTKENVLKAIMGEIPGSTTTGGSVTPGTTTPAESWPKTVAGVTIPEEDKDKMILKLKVLGNKKKIRFGIRIGDRGKLNIDYGNGESDQELNLVQGKEVEYNQGEYIIKISGYRGFRIESETIENVEFEVLQWGKISESYDENDEVVELMCVTKIYEPEPDKVVVSYNAGKMTEIPEWLFSKKKTSTKMSKFHYCSGITSIPEDLFKNNVNVTDFYRAFYGCTGLTSIPEGLFKNNVNVTNFSGAFEDCKGLTSIPEDLFKTNIKVKDFGRAFYGCTGLTSISEDLFKNNVKAENFNFAFSSCYALRSIPEGLFKNNVNATDFWGTFENCYALRSIPEDLFKNNVNATKFISTFMSCTGLTSIPEGLFKNNVNVTDFSSTFIGCKGLTSIPEGLFKNNVNVIYFSGVFSGCIGLTSIPEGLFKNNVNVTNFGRAFYECEGLRSIPEELFENNTNVINFEETFGICWRITYIPEKIIEAAKKVKEKGGSASEMFSYTSASNYSSLPNYMK